MHLWFITEQKRRAQKKWLFIQFSASHTFRSREDPKTTSCQDHIRHNETFTSVLNDESSLKKLSKSHSAVKDLNLAEIDCLRYLFWPDNLKRWFGLLVTFFCATETPRFVFGQTMCGDRYPVSIPSPTSCHSTASIPHCSVAHLSANLGPIMFDPMPGSLYMLPLLLKMPLLPLFLMKLVYIFKT